MLVVGTNSTFITLVLSGCLPGYNGVTQTPLWPDSTRSPCLNSTPLTSTCAWPTYDMTTPTYPIGICTIGTCSTWANQGFRFHVPDSRICSCNPRRPLPSRN